MSILLVHPKYFQPKLPSNTSQATQAPLALAYLSSYLKQKSIPVYGIDLNLDTRETLFQTIVTKNIQIVGFSIITVTFTPSHELAKEIKQRFPHLKIIFGGMPMELFLQKLDERTIDVMVLGEGEETLYDLARHYLMDSLKLQDVPGIAFYKKGQIIQTDKRANPINLDQLPFPDRDIIDPKRYFNPYVSQCYITTSRSCPHKCNYCLSGNLSNTFRTRSIENVISEIRHIKTHYPFYNKLHFVDETFNVNPTRFKNLCLAIKKENIKWSANIKPDHTVTEESIGLVKDCGAIMVEMGIESGNQNVLDQINKKTSITHIEKLLKKAAEVNLPVIGTFMVPHVCDTPATLRDTIQFATHCVEAYMLIPITIRTTMVPKVPFYNLIDEYQVITSDLKEILHTRHLNRQTIDQTIDQMNMLQQKSYESNTIKLMNNKTVNPNDKDQLSQLF